MNDIPVTDAELKRAYASPSEVERGLAIGEAAALFDEGELGDVCAMNFEKINNLACFSGSGAMIALGYMIRELRNQRIAEIASRRLYGEVGHIKHSEVV